MLPAKRFRDPERPGYPVTAQGIVRFPSSCLRNASRGKAPPQQNLTDGRRNETRLGDYCFNGIPFASLSQKNWERAKQGGEIVCTFSSFKCIPLQVHTLDIRSIRHTVDAIPSQWLDSRLVPVSFTLSVCLPAGLRHLTSSGHQTPASFERIY